LEKKRGNGKYGGISLGDVAKEEGDRSYRTFRVEKLIGEKSGKVAGGR